jgi:hypothetical protein
MQAKSNEKTLPLMMGESAMKLQFDLYDKDFVEINASFSQ